MIGVRGIPEEHRQTIKVAIQKRYPKQTARILKEGIWNGLSSYYSFYCNGMFLGCEVDGHIHS